MAQRVSKKKVVLVTGGARGIGLGVATALAREVCDIAVADVTDESDFAPARARIETAGAAVLYCRADVSEAKGRARIIDAVKDSFGRLNVLVNNAGVAPKARADLLEATEESYDRVMGVNARGPHFLAQLAARWMIEQRKQDASFEACLVNVSSVSATVASPARGEYCMSKAALSMSTKLWAARLGDFGIPVYEVRPGIISTDMTAPVRDRYDKLIAEGLLAQSRWGTPDDVGRAVAMLVRGDLGYSTGQVVTVDGGLTLERL